MQTNPAIIRDGAEAAMLAFIGEFGPEAAIKLVREQTEKVGRGKTCLLNQAYFGVCAQELDDCLEKIVVGREEAQVEFDVWTR